MKNKSLTPQIRFKGYEDEWVSRPFSEIVTRYSLLKYDETIPSVEYEDINSKKGTLNKDIFSKPIHKSGQYFQIGDILFGKLRPYLGNNLLANFDGIAVGDFWIFKNGLANTRFIYPFLYSKDYSYISNISSGSKMPRSDWGLVSSWNFNIPSSEEEQTLIGGLFANIDKSIFEAEREITRLEKMKQASLQKMFPRPGETTPEIRFDGFTEPWKKVTFSDVFTPLKNNTLSRDCLNYTSGMAKNIHYGDVLIKFGAVININDEIVPYVNETVSFSQSPFHLLKDGDIIFADTAEDEAVGKCVEIIGATEFNSVSGLHTIAVRPNFSFAPSFLGYYLNSSTYHSQLLPLMQGVKVLSIGRNALATTEICYPTSHEEQCVIGEYFRNLDAIISAKRKKLEKLQNLKQSCLDKMFVNTTAQ